MPAIRNLPEPARVALKSLMLLDGYVFQDLISTLKSAAPSLYDSDYIQKLTPTINTLSQEVAQELIEALYNLSRMYFAYDLSVSQIAEDIADTVEQDTDGLLTPESRQLLVERLISLLNLDVFRLGAKANDLLFEYEHALLKAKIITDIRPVFGDDVTSSPLGAVIVHNLKIEYQADGERKEFFVAIDTRDTQLLIDLLVRAQSKADNLKALLAVANVRHIDFQ